MTEQELRDEFNRWANNEYGGLLKNYRKENYDHFIKVFKAGYSLSQETIEKQKKEIKTINQQKIKDWDEINGFAKQNIELKETIKAKDAEIEKLNIALDFNCDIALRHMKDKDKAITGARELVSKLLDRAEIDNDYDDYEKAKAWLERNK